MSDRVRELLEEALDSGRTPEEVCRDCPELLAAVRDQWARLKAVEAELDEVFPTPSSTPLADGSPAATLPRIPGYDIEAVLGRGGMGVVYRARHQKLNRPVAVKMLLAGAYASRQDLARFQQEAEAVAGLRHPNVVSVFDVGDLDGLPYFTMEFVEGGSLARQLAGMPQPAARAAALVATLAGAVEAAHRGGIVHRDLKPGNVLLLADGTPKVSDFGLARRFDAAGDTRTGAQVGTPSYMAPEQATGHAGPAVDVYSLGAILYETLTGRPPFRAETPSETVRQVLAEDPVPPSRMNRSVPRDLETICLKCLHKDPARRYPTAAALADDLNRFLRGESVSARRPGVFERIRKWARRRPGPAAALVGGLLLLSTLVGVGWWRASERASTRQAVEADLDEAARWRRQSAWAETRTALERARGRLGDGGYAELRGRLDQAGRELELVARLDAIRLSRASGSNQFDRARADRDYRDAFAAAGLGEPGDAPAQVADRVAASDVRPALVAALDDWAICTPDVARRRWLLEVARRADPDPAWGDRVRDPKLWDDATALTELARTAPEGCPSVPLLNALGVLLDSVGGDAISFLRRVQAAHPEDFWATFTLAELLDDRRDDDAVGFYRAALALRPTAVACHVNLGIALVKRGRIAEAVDQWQRAVRIDPNSSMAHYNLAAAYLNDSDFDRAVEYGREAVRLDPTSGPAHAIIAEALSFEWEFAEAKAVGERALELLPAGDPVRTNVTLSLDRCNHMLALQARLPAVLQGKDRPANPTEGVEMAELMVRTNRFGNAVRLYVAVFDADPGLADDLKASHRYYAACAAALAGTGRAADGPRSALARAVLRGRALVWLSAERDARVAQLAGGTPREQGRVLQIFRVWLTDEPLAVVREPARLARLPDAERRRWQEFWADVAVLAAYDPGLSVGQARAHAARGDWARAAESYARLFRVKPTDDGEAWFEYAAVQWLAGDRDGYRRTCAHMMARGPATPEMRPYHVARACTLAAGDPTGAGQLSANELRQNGTDFWSLTEQAALHYRAGRFAEAVPLLEQSLRAEPRPGAAVVNWLWLSLACRQLGRPADAAAWAGKATGWLDGLGRAMPADAEALGLHLHNWLEAQVLRRELSGK